MIKMKKTGGKFENINADHVKNPGFHSMKTWVLAVRKPGSFGVYATDFLRFPLMFSDLSAVILNLSA